MAKVLVIGDVIIDNYIFGTATRLSPEAPVPVINFEKEIESLGGAGLVYENLIALGVDVELLNLSNPKCVKTRIICDGHYITRIDEDHITNGQEVYDKILLKDFSNYEYVILSDYNKGVLEKSLNIIEHVQSFGCKVIVDPKKHKSFYNNAWLVKPNEKEFEEFKFVNWDGNIIKTSANKEVVAKFDDIEYRVMPKVSEVADVTGAGDCFLAAFVYGLVNNKGYEKSLQIAVNAATESVKHVGTYILKKSDVEDYTVFTNGVFDILHKGHLTLLQEARKLGNKLVVGINSDASVKRLKGKSRPINNEQTRLEQLEILPFVDEVVIFNEDTPYELIKNLKPDIIVKGGDYTVDSVVGNDLAEVHIVPTVEGYSTTKIIENSK